MLDDLAADSGAPRRVSVLGAGSWGTTFAKVLADGGSDTVLWARRAEIADEINTTHRNHRYLPGIALDGLRATVDLEEAVSRADQLYLAVPSQSLRENLRTVAAHVSDETIVVSLMKGVERDTRDRMSEVVAHELDIPLSRIAVLSGPNLAFEIAQEQPTASVVASARLATAREVARASTNRYFRAYVSTDVVGTELGGVLKNLIAIAVGIVDGVGYGENTKASIITRGLVEISDLAVALGARPNTMMGLAGLGDLIATCESPLSRNNTAGRLLGQGLDYHEVIDQMQQTAEGIGSVAPVLELAAEHDVDMPIVAQVAAVLAGTLDPRDIAPDLAQSTDEPEAE